MIGEEEEKKRLRPNAQGRVTGPQALGGSQQLLLCDLHRAGLSGGCSGKKVQAQSSGLRQQSDKEFRSESL